MHFYLMLGTFKNHKIMIQITEKIDFKKILTKTVGNFLCTIQLEILFHLILKKLFQVMDSSEIIIQETSLLFLI